MTNYTIERVRCLLPGALFGEVAYMEQNRSEIDIQQKRYDPRKSGDALTEVIDVRRAIQAARSPRSTKTSWARRVLNTQNETRLTPTGLTPDERMLEEQIITYLNGEYKC